MQSSLNEVLQRIDAALSAAHEVFERFTPGAIQAEYKAGHDPVTEADRALDVVLKQHLLHPGEGWLSEESADNADRLACERVWIVDPLDGTREFVQGIPEFCASIGYIVNGKAVAGGIYNPATKETFLGTVDRGVTYNGKAVHPRSGASLDGARILASRSEVKRGEWEQFKDAPFETIPMGSVAYKLGLVAAGLADATFTLTPKHEWDVAGGVALVLSGGGFVRQTSNSELRFNQKDPLLPGLIACGQELSAGLLSALAQPIDIAPR
jgi:myo-inositol-1(or 4)-monophosphatase